MPTHRFLKIACLAPVAAALAVPAGAGAALPGAGHGFGGITNQSVFGRGDGGAVELRISKDGKSVARATATLELTCTSGASYAMPDRYRKLRIRSNRSFGTKFKEPDGSAFGSISGSFNAGRTAASGTWSLTEVFKDDTGATTDTCKSGRVKWSVKR